MTKLIYVGKQRSGTTSFGDFFEKNGFRRFGWREIVKTGFSELHHGMKWNQILEDGMLEKYDVFEDGPFSDPMFALFIYRNVPDVRLVYLERPSEDWFRSMVTHTYGFNPGDLYRHCFNYDLLPELYWLEKNSPNVKPEALKIELMKGHYERKYVEHKMQVRYIFNSLPAKHVYLGHLYEKDVFLKVANHLDLTVRDSQTSHSNSSKQSIQKVIEINNLQLKRLKSSILKTIRKKIGKLLGR